MKFKELLTVLDNNTYLNIVSEKGHRIYEGKVKLVDVKRAFINELFITMEDK